MPESKQLDFDGLLSDACKNYKTGDERIASAQAQIAQAIATNRLAVAVENLIANTTKTPEPTGPK